MVAVVFCTQEVGAIIRVDLLGQATPGDETLESDQERLCSQIRDDLYVTCFTAEANKNRDIRFNKDRLACLAILEGEGPSMSMPVMMKGGLGVTRGARSCPIIWD